MPHVILMGLLPINLKTEELKQIVWTFKTDHKCKPNTYDRLLNTSNVGKHVALSQGQKDVCTVGVLSPPAWSRGAEASCCYCYCCSCGVFITSLPLVIMPSLSLLARLPALARHRPLSSPWHSATNAVTWGIFKPDAVRGIGRAAVPGQGG